MFKTKSSPSTGKTKNVVTGDTVGETIHRDGYEITVEDGNIGYLVVSMNMTKWTEPDSVLMLQGITYTDWSKNSALRGATFKALHQLYIARKGS
jgi:hypothetical protein